jgi:hypothetical protein
MFYISANEKWSIPRTFNNASDLGRLLTGYTFLATIGYLQSLDPRSKFSGKVDTKTTVAFFHPSRHKNILIIINVQEWTW